MTIHEVNVTGLTLSKNSNIDFDSGIDFNLIEKFTSIINPNYDIEFVLNTIYDSYREFSYTFNASLNMSGNIYVEATKEADYYIDDGGLWIFGKI